MPVTPETATSDQEVLKECRERFRLALDAETDNRANAQEALEFRDGHQWPDDLYNQRKIDRRPSLTINHTNTFCRRVCNNMRQQRPRIKVHPVGDGADKEVADVLQGIVRHIENISSADIAYDTGGESAVNIGWGYWRVYSEYISPESFDQEIKIVPIRNAFTVYFDPSSVMPAGEDADWCIISEDMSREEYKRLYPNAEDTEWVRSGVGDELAHWATKDRIRLAEYYRIYYKQDTLYQMTNGMALFQDQLGKLSKELDSAQVDFAKHPNGHRIQRSSARRFVEWYKINGTEIIDQRSYKEKNPLPDKFIPIVRCEGNVLDMNGRVRRKGMVADLMDPARMYNYWRTQETEMLALAPKAPFIGAAGSFDGHPEWADANQKPYSRLEYEPTFIEQPDGSKTPLPPPQRSQPIAVPAGFVQAAQGAQQDLMAVAGMPHEPDKDTPGSVVSGVALTRRQALSDIGHFQYYDNQTRAIAHTGRIILDLIPFYYSTQRMQRIIGDDGVPSMVPINTPQAAQSNQGQDPTQQAETKIKNDLTIGRYDVVMDTGPGYETKRLEGAEAMIDLLKTPLAEPIAKVGADLVVRNMDFAGSEALADRLMPMNPQGMQDAIKNLPKEAQSIVTAMGQQVQQLQQALQHAQLELKYKGDIEKQWMQTEITKAHLTATTKAHDTELSTLTKREDTHVKAQSAVDVAEIKEAGHLLSEHVKGHHAAKAAEIAAAERAENASTKTQ